MSTLLNISREIGDIKDLIREFTTNGIRLTGEQKDRISDRLDNIQGLLEDFKDNGQITDKNLWNFKKILGNLNSKLDVVKG